ncbi:zinc ABC transporter substrate-binding protein [Paracoccus thiocyanatus]|uniref:High-affinity zinc uptake system protein ZnuA n=1 Tax=Paracoccus thiocyanatus TaxID=34006 RepID=A0A3D8PA62_9RHOB|nr:zinc ABC transporter substrate-binding protein [Paracoccus thiocyanatus]RDW12208.1 zinc ABC transporter substrate-binding protein [Paracoccus thiocyanatus]
MIRSSSFAFALALGAAALPAHAQTPHVVADIPVIGSLVQQVMGDLGQPEVLLEAGGNAHHYQLRPSQARSLQQAGLLVWVGPGLSPWLERANASRPADADTLTLLDLPQTHLRDFAASDAQAHDHDHDHEAHDHDHDHEADHGDHGHSHDGTDPHAWLDPVNGQAWLTAIAQALSRHDPQNAATYAANAERAAAKLAALDAELDARLEPARGQGFVVFHDAYGYFTDHYRLKPAIAISLGDASTPSAARLRAIREQVTAEGAACVFPEANHDPALVATVAEGTGMRQGAALDPAGSTAQPGVGLYPQMLRGMADALVDCLDR